MTAGSVSQGRLCCEHNRSPQTLLNVSNTQRSLSERCVQRWGKGGLQEFNTARYIEITTHKGVASVSAEMIRDRKLGLDEMIDTTLKSVH